MTSLLTHRLHHDTYSHFSLFFPPSATEGMRRGSSTHQLSLWWHHTTLKHTHIFFFPSFLALPSAFFSWTVAVDPADILNYSGMLREAQVPGNLTPTALPSAWRDFLCPLTGGRRRKQDREEIMKRVYFCFLDRQQRSSSAWISTTQTTVSSSACLSRDGKRKMLGIKKQNFKASVCEAGTSLKIWIYEYQLFFLFSRYRSLCHSL